MFALFFAFAFLAAGFFLGGGVMLSNSHWANSSCSSASKAGTRPAFDEGDKAAAGTGSFLLDEEEGCALHSDSDEFFFSKVS